MAEVTITFQNAPQWGDVVTISGSCEEAVVRAIKYLEEQGVLKTPRPQVKEDK